MWSQNPEFIESPDTFRINLFRSDVFDTEAKHNDSSDLDNKSTSGNIGTASEKNESASGKHHYTIPGIKT